MTARYSKQNLLDAEANGGRKPKAERDHTAERRDPYKHYCIKCERELVKDEIALYRKLVMRGATEYMCLDCLAEHFDVTVEMLKDKIEYFKKTGCALF